MTAETRGQLEPVDLTIDAQFLTTVAYSSAAGLAARQAIYQYQKPRTDFVAWTVERLGLRGEESVADIGCGNGRFITAICAAGHRGPVLGVDLSRGMLAEVDVPAGAQVTLVNADIQRLPLASNAFDTVLCMQMLHHVPDIPAALAEAKRILAPGGTLVVGVNGADHLAEFDELVSEAVTPAQPAQRGHRFGLPQGLAVLKEHFSRVEQEDLPAQLLLTNSTPVVRYLMSMGRLRFSLAEAGVDLLATFARIRDIVDAVIRRDGAFRVTTHIAIVKCS